MSRLIPLTRGQFAIVDDDNYDALSQHKWHALKQPHTYYAARNVKVAGKKVTFWMHRVVNQTPDGMLTDHRNGNGLDNQKHNLRAATHQDNMINNARHVIGSSQYRGVSWHIRMNCWVAQITVDRRNIYVGRFDTEEAAHEAYEIARTKYRAGKLCRMEQAA